MRSKELIKKVKQEVKYTKDQALRQALTKKKEKGATSQKLKELLESIVNDKSEEKLVGHLKMKAHALDDKTAFIGYTKGQLNYLCILYNVPFKKSTSKTLLNTQLIEKVSAVDKLPHPTAASKRIMDTALRLYAEGKKATIRTLGLRVEQGAAENANEDIVIPAVPDNSLATNRQPVRERLNRFRATKEQEELLIKDFNEHSGKVPKQVRVIRATEFGIQESQVLRWLKSYSKK